VEDFVWIDWIIAAVSATVGFVINRKLRRELRETRDELAEVPEQIRRLVEQ
jgi:hypothetical protein